MKNILDTRFHFMADRVIILHIIINTILLVASFFATYYATQYTEIYTDNIIPDILLDHLPVVNVGFIFFQGAFAFVVLLVFALLLNPLYIPFTLGCSSLFFFIRSIFMTMTHLSAPVVLQYSYIEHEHSSQDILFSLSSGNDLFFSGHAGYPFLLALMFWDSVYIRYILLTCSAVAAISVLLGHLHYSIDVFSAYFIAFGIFSLSKYFFKKEWGLIVNKIKTI